MTNSDFDPSRAFRLATARPGRTVAFDDVRIRVLRRRHRRAGAAAAAVLAAAAALVGALLLAPLPGGHGQVVPESPPSAPRSATTSPPGTSRLSGLIVFRRYANAEGTSGSLFLINADGTNE